MSTTATSVRSTITLKGSTETVTEFFQYAVSSILYQRGIYPPENFEPKKQYGLTVMSVKDTKLAEYLNTVLRQFSGRREGLQLVLNYNLNIATLEEQLWWYSIQVEAHYAHTPYSDWLATGTLQKVVLVVTAVGSRDVLERWAFDIETDADIAQEIQAIIRQITASVTFLPLLSDRCVIDLLAYTKKDSDIPVEWEESDPRYISNGADVKLRSFSTKIHSVDTSVSYKVDVDA
ncbi:hypothetical protein H632_c674p2 [Helicosporidium sp. ATCC 50920]|nr:hypothetical protein H632_c674p2 [Helicosporidium sp. ATCC 50920]|eukprot:KDD75461.1 hypothetical protein H632_c674p2 [Helicosporidium sp. ATCC 50920]